VRYDHETLRKILQDCEQSGATDIHFKVPGRPRFRVDGKLVPTAYPELRPEHTQRIAQEVLALGRREIPLNSLNEYEFSFGVHRIGRFRAFLYRQRGSIALVLHRMAGEPPSLVDLGADAAMGDAIWEEPGLVLVCSQKQRLALMASLVRHYNIHHSGYLLSVEHPLEYLHADGSASVAQREVPHDTPSIAEGMRFGLTGDCDAVVVSDIPDAEAAELALQMAESGRRVVASMVGCPWREAPRWFARRFPQAREREITDRLRRVLRQVVFEDDGRIGLAQSQPKAVAS
jgi:twitching motility protein PilT